MDGPEMSSCMRRESRWQSKEVSSSHLNINSTSIITHEYRVHILDIALNDILIVRHLQLRLVNQACTLVDTLIVEDPFLLLVVLVCPVVMLTWSNTRDLRSSVSHVHVAHKVV